MSVLPPDLIKEMKQSTTKGQWEAVACEFGRKCAWRIRHFEEDELLKIAGNVIPATGGIISINYAAEFLGNVQCDIQSAIAQSHELAGRLFMRTPFASPLTYEPPRTSGARLFFFFFKESLIAFILSRIWRVRDCLNGYRPVLTAIALSRRLSRCLNAVSHRYLHDTTNEKFS